MMRTPCKYTHYHANGLAHTPGAVCDCPPPSAAQRRAELEAFIARLRKVLPGEDVR